MNINGVNRDETVELILSRNRKPQHFDFLQTYHQAHREIGFTLIITEGGKSGGALIHQQLTSFGTKRTLKSGNLICYLLTMVVINDLNNLKA